MCSVYLPYISPISPIYLELEQQLSCARLRRIRLLRVRTRLVRVRVRVRARVRVGVRVRVRARLLARLPPRRLEVAAQVAYEQLLPRHGLARGAPRLGSGLGTGLGLG